MAELENGHPEQRVPDTAAPRGATGKEQIEGRRPEGPDADWVHLPDPIADAIKGLARRIESLERASDPGREPRENGHGGTEGGWPRGPADEQKAPGAPGDVNRTIGPNPAGG